MINYSNGTKSKVQNFIYDFRAELVLFKCKKNMLHGTYFVTEDNNALLKTFEKLVYTLKLEKLPSFPILSPL